MFSLIFINVFFYRLGEHGTDRSAQILVFILLYELICLLYDKNNYNFKLNKIFLLLSIIISLKAFYVLYIILLLPILFYGFFLDRLKFILSFIKNKFFIIFSTSFLLVIITNFFNSGCLIFPITFTCIENMPWSHSLEHVARMNKWYEQWSKAGAGPNFRVDDPENYILSFNWFSNWINEYFFNKVSDFLLGLLFIILVSAGLITFKSKKKFSKKRKIFSIYLLLILLFLEWLYNHPSLRYGGYVVIGLLDIIPSSILLENFINKKMVSRIKVLVLISFLVFFVRNIDRINNEIEKYDYRPLHHPYFIVDANYYKIDKKLKLLVNNYHNCITNQNCENHDINKVKKAYGKIYFVNSN